MVTDTLTGTMMNTVSRLADDKAKLRAALKKAQEALMVIALDPKIDAFLQANDPKANRQVTDAAIEAEAVLTATAAVR